jgi:hypothetical protein
MSAARGDRKPCTRSGCSGTMQFSRQPLPKTPEMMTADGERGWVCSEHAEHFQLGAERATSEPIGRNAAHASWDDDGGPARGELRDRARP